MASLLALSAASGGARRRNMQWLASLPHRCRRTRAVAGSERPADPAGRAHVHANKYTYSFKKNARTNHVRTYSYVTVACVSGATQAVLPLTT